MGYKKYAKDYEIEYADRVGKKRPEAVRIYVGPYFKFEASAEEIKKLKITYLIAAVVSAIALLIPMCIDCAVTRTLYVQLPAVIAWIPWLLAACSVWRLWTAKEKAELTGAPAAALLNYVLFGLAVVYALFGKDFCLRSIFAKKR